MIAWNNFLFVGIIYDVIIEPPSVGSTTDENGHTRPVSVLLILLDICCLHTV